MNNQEKLWKIGQWVGVLLVVFLAVISIKEIKAIGYIGKDTQVISSITVNGKGEAITIPDIATFSFSVNETAKTVEDAKTKATDKINNALAAIKASGVEKKDIKTLSYSINPHYEYNQGVCTTFGCPGGKQVLTGYDVAQSIEVKIRDLTKAGELFDTVGKAGIQTVNGLNFGIDNIDIPKAAARADAIAKAQAKAQKIASDLGVSLVRITSYYDSSDDQVYYGRESMDSGMVSAKAMMAPAAVAPEIPTGEQKITATVSITYEIR